MSFSSSQSCCQFTFSDIQHATKNFDESLVIGHGGFGKVYRGTITYEGVLLDVAIKRLESGSSQGAAEFWAEVEMLSKLRHCHLVSLIGYCNDGREMILVYDYMPKGTLADHIHKRGAPIISWVRRLKICIGAARGLDYLHTGTGIMHGVIHRDVKTSNILLDNNWGAKISDFGLSKIGPINQPSTYVNTLVRGTFGYFDPDYYQTGRLTRKSDVYAFGVVLFEVLSGKQAVDSSIDEEQWSLATWAQDSIKEGRLKQIVDSKLRGRISPKCLKEFALLANRCLNSRPKQRPTMAEVVVCLESILALQDKVNSRLRQEGIYGQLLPMDVRFFGRRMPTFLIPSYRKNSGGDISLHSLDVYLYGVLGEDQIVQRFDFNTIVYATKNFALTNRLSIARYGFIYKGRLQNGQDVTISKHSHAIRPSITYKECMNEASILVKSEHENMIQLLGYCIDGKDAYLLYDFAPSATLHSLLFDPMCELLDWNKRNFDPRLSSFGLAMAFDNETDYIDVDTIRGTYGYIAPEYWLRGRLSIKADVYSFGVLVLETISGRRIIDFTRTKAANYEDEWLISYVRRNCLEGTLSDIIDPRINVDSIIMAKFVETGLLCVQQNAEVRPTMEEVVGMLTGAVSLTLPVSEMRARMNAELYDLPPDSFAHLILLDSEDYDILVQLKNLH